MRGSVAIAYLLALWLPGRGNFTAADQPGVRIPPGSAPPGQVWITQDAPGTDRQPKIGVTENLGGGRYHLTLCPNTSHDLDISKAAVVDINKPTARSDNPAVATSAVIRSGPHEHWTLRIHAGPNDTREVKKTSVSSEYSKRRVNLGMNAGPSEEYVKISFVIEVEVLPAERCREAEKQNPAPPDKRRTATPAVKDSIREISLCVGGSSQVIKMESEIRRQASRIPAEGSITPPTPLRGFQVIKDTTPGVAEVKVIQKAKNVPPVSLRFQGLQSGETLITLAENPLPVNVVPFQQTYKVVVKPCSKQEIIQAPAPKEGYHEEPSDVLKPPPEKSKAFDDDDASFTTPQDALALQINDARRRNGRPVLGALPQPLVEVARQYSRRLADQMITTRQCDHDLAEWEALRQRTNAREPLTPIGEVLACARPQGRWDPQAIVAQWNRSTHHHDILLIRPAASHLSCEHVVARGMEAAVCITWGASRH